MTLRHLEIFLAAAVTDSMWKAAERLYISQPNVSRPIWEKEYTLRHSSDHAILRIGATLTIGTCVLPEILR